MSLSYRVARGSLARSSNLRCLSQWSLPTATAANASRAKRAPIAAKYMSTSTSGGSLLTTLAKENPYKDVVRYEFKNRKWNLHHVDFYSEALAIGLLENGLQPGDVVLSWLPAHFSESTVLQFACSKAGLVLYNLDPTLATKDPDAAKEALSQALTLTKANVLISQEAGSDVNYVRLCESVIPEIRFFDFAEGKPFITPRFPHLRLPIHTGFDQDDKWGMLLLKQFVVPADNLNDHLQGFTVDGSTPLLGELIVDAKGIPTGTGSIQTNDEVATSGVLETYSKILSRDFHVVEGEGVVW
uniref:AMP-dependent synthetase/ligase domain-containing protein n=1 Tax=Pseudo-nitzschia australis TaxID=44445 RepID=A0A7S4A8Y6_9STRA|mmetsp:Transcript_1386/g.3070  ORF Transcript_1386/g.3070 Transcript_1386/m.3070 type:complete len:299 (-) Transcript_1386:208-1104(-)